MGRPLFRLSVWVALAALSLPIDDAQAQGRLSPNKKKEGESADYALRRAQAFHDLYAGSEEKSEVANAKRTFSARTIGQPAAIGRPLPIYYPSVNRDAKLNALTAGAPAVRFPGSTFRTMTPGAPPQPGIVWRNLGPTNTAGRVSSLAVDPHDPKTIYRGTAGGGLWRSRDGGVTWTPLTDSLGNLSIGAVALAPKSKPEDPQVIYMGTGEGVVAIDGIDGIGFLRSPDGGETWDLPVSVSATKFFAINVHPAKSMEVLVATSGGIQKSTDGGKTWATKLANVYGTDLARLPGAPQTVLATVWDVATANQTGRGFIYRSTDGGDSWTKVAGAGLGIFDAEAGRMALAVSISKPGVAYVLAASAQGDSKDCRQDPVDQTGVYRSEDGGQTWSFRSNPITGSCDADGHDSILGGQGWYATAITVSPTDPNVLVAGGLDVWRSADGGGSWTKQSRWHEEKTSPTYSHADIHAFAWAGNRLLIGDDGGVGTSSDVARSFSRLDKGITTKQYYSLGISPTDRDLLIGGAQDNGTDIRIGASAEFLEVIGGDGFAVAVNAKDPKVLYGSVYNSRIFRSTDGGKKFSEISPKYSRGERRPFITPLTMDPNNSSVLYTGSHLLWKTADGGTTWSKTSETDLADAFGGNGYLTKVAVASLNSQFLLASASNGTVKLSKDGGASWTLQTGLPGSYTTHVEFDPKSLDVFYATYTASSPGGLVYKTIDGGKSFTRVDRGLPRVPVHVLRVDPKDQRILYVGTDVGLYRSTDGGAQWDRYVKDLPAVSIWDIAILSDRSAMRLASHGRGFFEIKLP
ncbi:WD40/YVTN/BNR-like repeat-containing protein [Usitatibacter palustris]|uniref:Xyloglucanase n=1 Tax=Usitatibacter palustris TaxID=2732487 RepID=A0A6M4HDN8_9PROT|nr:YCF48-related protein [Usitatibacter palustris]QJR16704.1 Xyloglucanase [Usitatibacter palustris]